MWLWSHLIITWALSYHMGCKLSQSSYVSAPGLVQQISSLQSDLMALQSDLDKALPDDRSRCINNLWTLIQSLQQLLFTSSTTAQPILTPWVHNNSSTQLSRICFRVDY
ncbi:putative HAUS augmin-like complex subunit 3 [Helianthus debilis subsp. tardiflorus]